MTNLINLYTSAILLIVCFSTAAFAELKVESVMYNDPKFEFPKDILETPNHVLPLWLEALEQSEFELKRRVIEAFAEAHASKMKGLEQTIAPMLRELDAPEQHPKVQLAIAKTLVAMDQKQTTELLFRLLDSHGLAMALVVEPALAKWDYQPARAMWMQRLVDRPRSNHRMKLAIRGLAEVQEQKAHADLIRLATASRESAIIRLEAADGLGKLGGELLPIARELASEGSSTLNRMVAARMLASASGSDVEVFLRQLALDKETTVGNIAAQRLLQISPDTVMPIIDRVSVSPDANIRETAAKTLTARPSPENVKWLGPFLDDPHPKVRGFVREELFRMATKLDLKDEVLAEAIAMSRTDRWRGIEQSLLILTELDHKPSADRMVALLEFERPEVFMTAAYGLRRLAVPETLAPMLAYATRMTPLLRGSLLDGSIVIQVDHEVSQLFQAFGQMKYKPAEALMREYIPKNTGYPRSRRAAVWALGYLHEGQPQAALVSQLAGRANDQSTFNPEDTQVRRMAVVSLARMKAVNVVPTLRSILASESPRFTLGYACAWGIHKLDGDPLPKLKPKVVRKTQWFLVPFGEETRDKSQR
ncbi:MAG: hypothetical protein CMJ78_05240 [Planctomycetaceae bacterium]|nr:hypothetical protein [Planctomycetaceae bacterium]